MFLLTFAIFFLIELFKGGEKKSGEQGEKDVIAQLSMLSKEKYILLNDIMLETSHGTTSQIDHVIVSKLGIFPIETKNYSGFIRGREDDKEWTQDMLTHENKFYNPIKQNTSHVNALKDVLGIKENNVFRPIVAFSNDCVLDVDTESPVVYIKNLCATVEDYYAEKLAQEDVDRIIKTLKEKNITSKTKRKQHNRFVAEKKKCLE